MVPVQNIVPPVRTDPCRIKHETIKHHKQAENSYLNILVYTSDALYAQKTLRHALELEHPHPLLLIQCVEYTII